MASYQLEYDEKGPFLWALVESYCSEVCANEIVTCLVGGELEAIRLWVAALPEFERLNRGDKNAELRLDKYYVVFEKNEQHGAE